MEFPVLVYKDGGTIQRAGGFYSQKTILDDADFALALLDGWFATLPEAIEGKNADVAEDDAEDLSAPTRAELEQKANELGIRFDGRTTDKGLSARIAEALKG